MYFTSGSDRAFEQLMQTRPGADHFDSGEAGAPEDCGTCRFYRLNWKYQFCVYEECPYQPGKHRECSHTPGKIPDPAHLPDRGFSLWGSPKPLYYVKGAIQ